MSEAIIDDENLLIAFLDDTPAAHQVLKAALGVAKLLGTEVEALHVSEGPDSYMIPTQVAGAENVNLRLTKGPVTQKILEELEELDVFGGVIGTRALLGGARPAGSVALQVTAGAFKPLVLVPPEAVVPGDTPRRLLVPLDGSVAASTAFLTLEHRFPPDTDRQIDVLLTFDGLGPSMEDHSPHGTEAWGREFVERHCPGQQRTFHGREGDPGNAVIEEAERAGSDLIVLSFGGTIEAGHGTVIREVLSRSRIPVLILPIGTTTCCGTSTPKCTIR